MTHFANSLAHLLAELERLDLRLRAAVARLRQSCAEDPQFRGLYISEKDVDVLLQRPAGQPGWAHPSPGLETPLAALRQQIDQGARRSAERGIDLRLVRLRRDFGLCEAEAEALLLCLACELDQRYERLCAYLQDDVTKKRPGVDLVLDLLSSSLEDKIAKRGLFQARAPLLAWRLVDVVNDPSEPAAPLRAKSLKLPERITAFLLDDDGVDETLRTHVRLAVPTHGVDTLVVDAASLSGLQAVVQAARAGEGAAAASHGQVVHLLGPRGIGKRDAAAAVCFELARPLLVVELDRLTGESPAVLDGNWALLAREARLQQAVLYLRGFDALLVPANRLALERLAQRLQHHGDLVFLAGQHVWEPAGEARGMPFVSLRLPALDVAARTRQWDAALAELPALGLPLDTAALAGKFRFGPVQIRDAAASGHRLIDWHNVAGQSSGDDPAVMPAAAMAAMHNACRLHSNQKLASVARKITPTYRWSDIVLPADRLTMLRDICNHMKYRGQVYGDWGFGRKLAMGKGLAVLFAGPSGTGKTMAAEIIASELGLDLFKIDLASVISKFIGETEKNLASIFDEAETSNAILFFDEADALFGKRSEVRDSHDRYANVEVGYLLQRLEEYEGVAILATNFRKNMDEAFVRRLHFTVEFPFPSQADRRTIWSGIWPVDTPRDASVDADELGRRFEMTGGNIRNVALAAAFLAADEGGSVGFSHVMRATQREYQKMGKLIDDKNFVATGR